ncbi:ABC transporter ATP-binding protein/permease [uncultured Solobacterium sp.]|uniref:ABC transporter ATP-binding protein/permease n=1 Tax=uncultured Solobacterium sp. TaxID=747375 RepID=UPI0028DCACDF|nr:ABC transporter ATP-binding protein/permease [uncultured Solobacterium sp.]
MLQLKNIVKSYTVGELTQVALKGISLNFRDNEFVSILGQSGSGKTTMLNIIGGLDRYDSGDLVINGISTKKYRDADWDAYRNTSIGFVFQSYNLIPHQNVLSNVEMALTLSGVSRKERRRRAMEVLEKVGLQDHVHKKPNQLSGGQMQRVAIARALINNPDILLADEPTGALDTETSIQIMNLLKQIAEEKLVIMVTHNPELAEAYSTRIVNLKDGQIISDTDPYAIADERVEEKLIKNPKRISMSFWTSLGLSFANLRTKIGRTILTSFAGSIGIIGIALILALSTGMNQYITRVQKETMTSYPITISSQTVDATSIMQLRTQMMGLSSSKETQSEDGKVHADYQSLKQSDAVTNNLIQNNLAEFKKYLDDPSSEIHQYVGENGIIYSYNISFGVYAKNPNQQLIDTNSELDGGNGNSNRPRMFNFANMGVNNQAATNFSEMVAGTGGQPISSVVTDSYDMVAGSWPTSYNEVVMVLNENNGIPVQSMYQLGFITKEQYTSAKNQLANKQDGEDFTLSYEDMLQKTFYLVPSSENYLKNENGSFSQIKNPEYDSEGLMNKSIPLKVTGIIRPKEDAKNATINTAVAYTNLLTNYVIDRANESAIVQAQKNTPEINVLNGVRFNATTDEEKIQDTKKYLLNLSDNEKANMYQLILYYDGKSQNQETDVDTNSFDMNALSKLSMNPQSSMSSMLENYLNDNPNTTTLLAIYNDYIGGKSLEKNLSSFGAVSYESPSSISIYADSFENKDAIGKEIENYNNSVGEDSKISYTDYVALMTSSLTTIINGISYVLIAFVAVSLIVSSIMIGIITYISVMERTKEIGILRALGASKKNISQLFNAETFIIGIFSGILGISITLLLLIPINNVIQTISKIEDLSAVLPLESAGVLILISIVITVIGGFIPSQSAAKKDPVEALRTE